MLSFRHKKQNSKNVVDTTFTNEKLCCNSAQSKLPVKLICFIAFGSVASACYVLAIANVVCRFRNHFQTKLELINFWIHWMVFSRVLQKLLKFFQGTTISLPFGLAPLVVHILFALNLNGSVDLNKSITNVKINSVI